MATQEQLARAEVYRDASLEHMTAAAHLRQDGRYVLAAYVAGLSVECILRAYRLRLDAEFDSRHDLGALYKLSGFADVVPPDRAEDVGAALGTVADLWSNDYRFLSTPALRRRWTQRRLYGRVKGDLLEGLTSQLVNAAINVVSVGGAQWKRSLPR